MPFLSPRQWHQGSESSIIRTAFFHTCGVASYSPFLLPEANSAHKFVHIAGRFVVVATWAMLFWGCWKCRKGKCGTRKCRSRNCGWDSVGSLHFWQFCIFNQPLFVMIYTSTVYWHLFTTLLSQLKYWHLFHAAVKVNLKYAASLLVLDMHTGTFVSKKHWLTLTVTLTNLNCFWVNVIFRPYGRKLSLKFRYFPEI